jgi:hypothetical protein
MLQIFQYANSRDIQGGKKGPGGPGTFKVSRSCPVPSCPRTFPGLPGTVLLESLLQTLKNNMTRLIFGFKLQNRVHMKNLREEIKMMSVNQISVYHTLLEAYNVRRHLSSEQIHMKWKLIERKYALRSITKKKLNVPEKPKLKCLGFTYSGAKLFNMKKMEDPNTFKTMTKDWIWENIPSY